MKFPIFASVIVFCAWLAYQMHRSRKQEKMRESDFWARENEANSTRRKPLDDLNYLHIPFADLPMTVMTEDAVVLECHETLRRLAEQPIVNFTGITNTDLKLRYGAPNIDLLSRYDHSYTVLARTLQKWAEALTAAAFHHEAVTILEFAVSTETDVSRSYFLLADLYQKIGTPAKIAGLIPIADNLNTSLREHIVRELRSKANLS